VYQALLTVTGLQRGRTSARETPPVAPVAAEHVRAVLPHVRPEVAGMIELQALTGMRPGEVCAIRPCDLDRSGDVWLYKPTQHKTAWRGKSRVVAIGPKGQGVLRRFWPPADAADYFFSPRRAVADLHAARTASRKTPKYPSHMQRNARKRVRRQSRPPSACYDASSYGHAVVKGVMRANRPLVEAAVDVEFHVPNWSPNQLRHAHATAVRSRYDLEHAGAALGHTKMSATEIYAERDIGLAIRVAKEMG
jgi:integrase